MTGPRALARALAAGLAAAVVAGCAAAPVSSSPAPPGPVSPGPAAPASAQAAATTKSSATCDPQASSLAPQGTQVAPGSFMAKIRARGYLIAGVDQSTYHFGFLNPLDDKIEGFDIDMIRAVAQAIFGNPGKVEYKAISDAQRIPDIRDGSVDIVAHTMTISCDRLAEVDFSSVYFEAHQRVLVLKNSTVTGLGQLGGQRVCATTGSDSATFIAKYPAAGGHPVLVTTPFWTDCLVELQQGQVAAVSTDDSILFGLAAQDPFTKVIGSDLTNEPYGLAISKEHPEFVRFVNAVLAAERSDGAWEKSYQRWVSPKYQAPPVAEYAG